MTVFEMIADERRCLADLLGTLNDEQLRTPSLVPTWTVRDVAAHLVVSVDGSMPRFALAMLLSRGDFDKAIDKVTWWMAKRPTTDLIETLRRKADSRFVPPGCGPEVPLTDVIVHGLDLRRPLGVSRTVPEERARIVLGVLAETAAKGIVRNGWQQGLRFEATDIGWSYGQGPLLRGPSDSIILAIAGRVPALAELQGDGVEVLRSRFASVADFRPRA